MVRNKVGHHGASALFIAALSAQSQMVSLLEAFWAEFAMVVN